MPREAEHVAGQIQRVRGSVLESAYSMTDERDPGPYGHTPASPLVI